MTNAVRDKQPLPATPDPQQLPFPPGAEDSLLTRWQRIRALRRDMFHYVVETPGQYGDLYYWQLGGLRTYMAFHPDHIRELLVTQAPIFRRSRVTSQLLVPLVGNGLVVSEGEYWRKQRRLIQPAFHRERITGYTQQMVAHTESMLARWQDGQTFDLAEEMMGLTLGIATATLFGGAVSDMTGAIGPTIKTAQEAMIEISKLVVPMPYWVPIPANRRLRRSVQQLDTILLPLIEARRRANTDTGDLLSMLLLTREEDGSGAMSDQEVRDEAMTMFIAGHETSSNALTWTLYLLSQHPEIEEKLLDEVQRVLQGNAPTVEQVGQLVYTEMVIKEALRLYPPTWINSREALEETAIGGYRIAKGSIVVFSPYVVHHDERWHPDPERFDPDRFTPNGRKRSRGAYLPFGMGPHTCIGNAFAMMEMKIALALIVQKFHLSHVADHLVELDALITLRPKHGIWMTVTER
ncbi:MAG: cytochrome P450 [Caldilineaceae bacterium]